MKFLKIFFSYFEEIFSSIFLVTATVLVIMNVFLRYFLKTGFVWTEEVTTACFVWGVFLGAAAAYKRRAHVSVDTVIKQFPPMAKKITQLIIDLLQFILVVAVAYLAVRYVKISRNKPTPVLGISSVYISASILVSFILMSIYSVKFIIMDIKNFVKKEVC